MSNLEHALNYARRGWHVHPIRPGTKRPTIDNWTDTATTDPTLIRDWWTRWPDHGIGILTGHPSRIFVLDIDTGPTKQGDETLHDLETTYGPLPHTLEVITGSGGRHIYFQLPPGLDIRNDQAGRLGPGLDIRANGGQVVAPPTIHTTGTRYEWEADSDPQFDDPAPAPGWLIALLTTTPTPNAARRERQPARPDRDTLPGSWFETQITWPELLETDGATYLDTRTERTTGTTYELWSRPPLPGENFTPHTSATLYYKGSDVLKVFTSNWQGIDPETGEIWRLEPEATYTKFGYFAARHYGGNLNAAASELARRRNQTQTQTTPEWLDSLGAQPATNTDQDEPIRHGWEPADLATALTDGYQPPQPDLIHLDDTPELHLFYRGHINLLMGESGAGKTWLANHATAQLIKTGHDVLIIDYEDTVNTTLERLKLLGCTDQQIIRHVTWISPETPWGPAPATYIDQLLNEHDIALAIIDSTGEAMANDGISPNADDEVARWIRQTCRFITRRGPAILLIDHQTKEAADRTSGAAQFAIGSQRKRAAATIAWRYDVITAPTRTTPGRAQLVCTKDRHGTWRRGTPAIDIRIDPAEHRVRIHLELHTSTDRLDELKGRIWTYVHTHPQSSKAQIEAGVKGRRDDIRDALAALISGGYIDIGTRGGRGGGTAYTTNRLWITDVHGATNTPHNQTSPNLAQPRPGEVPKPDEPRPTGGPPPLGGGPLGEVRIGAPKPTTQNEPPGRGSNPLTATTPPTPTYPQDDGTEVF